MSNVNKLTYYQICLFAFQNRFNEIPAEYNIVWTGHQPCKVFEIELNSNCLKFTQNEIPIPTKINIKGEYIVHVPSSYHEMFNNIMEFGDIFIDVLSYFFFYFIRNTFQRHTDIMLQNIFNIKLIA